MLKNKNQGGFKMEEDVRQKISNLYKENRNLKRSISIHEKIDQNRIEIEKLTKLLQQETLPEGYVAKEMVSDYWGSHPEYAGNERVILGIPHNFPEFEISHGSNREHSFEISDTEKVPEEFLEKLYIWNTFRRKWEKFSRDLDGDHYWERIYYD